MKLPNPRHLESVPAPAATGDLDEQLLAIFFDQMPMGIAVFDADRRLQRCSRSWAGFFVTYLGVDADYVRPGARIEELIPGNDDALRPLVEGVLAGNVIRQQAHRLEKDGVVAYWDVVFAPVFADGKVVGFVDVVTDATERRLAYEALETRVSVLARLASAMTVDRPLPVTVREATTAAVEATGAVAAECVVTPPAGEAVTATTGTTGTTDDGTGRETQQVVLPVATAAHTFGRLVAHYPLGYDAEDELATLQAIADLAAAAIENARLFGEAEAHAATLEKQRLARDLHDSVSQALFSMTLRARTAQRLLAQLGPGTAGDTAARLSEQLEELSALTSGALAEMRALIFELRPDALAAQGLVAALTRQAQAMSVREGVPITVTGPPSRPELEAAVEEHLYRIALEALHNSLKHARAGVITVEVRTNRDLPLLGSDAEPPARLVLRVRDDGTGFDPDAEHPGHLGQRTMRERAEAIGARLQVSSSPGAGTTVEVRVPRS